MNKLQLRLTINAIEEDIRNQHFLSAIARIKKIRDIEGIPSPFTDIERNNSSLKLLKLEMERE